MEWQGIDAPCPHWEHFVTEIMGDDPEMAAFLQRVFGYGVTGLAREHIFLVLFGRGRNGKGIMTEVIQTVLGEQNATTALAGPVQSEMLLDREEPQCRRAQPGHHVSARSAYRFCLGD